MDSKSEDSPLPGHTAQQNVDAFITECRTACEKSGTRWEALCWSSVKLTKLGAPRNARGIVSSEYRLESEFAEFVKAYLWYSSIYNPTAAITSIYLGFRVLEKALIEQTGWARIWGCSIHVLDSAVRVATNHYGTPKASAHIVLSYLRGIAEFLDKQGLTDTPLVGWVSPVKPPDRKLNKIGKQAEEYRQAKLPDEEALDAIAEIFASDPQQPRDIITTSFVAMTMCAPSRGGEILELPIWSEVLEADKSGIDRYGWRFFAFKGYQGDIKWVPSSMESVGKTAFERIKSLTNPAREFARWVEDHPQIFYRHAQCPNVDEDEPLSMIDAALALGMNPANRQQASTALNYRKLPTTDGANTLKSLWGHVLNRLPKHFPWIHAEKRIKFSEALFCMFRNQTHATRAVIPVELQLLDVSWFTCELGPRPTINGHKSIFDRHDYQASNGDHFKLNTHQPRHLLNTTANLAGLSQEYIAKWSGRANPRQNRTYNHATDAEILAKVSEGIIRSPAPSSANLGARLIFPVKDDEFLGVITPATHVTDAGYCVHNWIISPCIKYRDCDNCEDQICVKGENEKLDRTRVRLARMEAILAVALAEADPEAIGADRWIANHQSTIQRLKQRIAMLTDDDLPDGSLIRLQGRNHSHLQRAMAKDIGTLERDNSDGQASICTEH